MSGLLIYGAIVLILGLPISIASYHILNSKSLRGFLIGLASLPIIIIVSGILLFILGKIECKDATLCEWVPLGFITFLGASVISIGSLVVTTLIIKIPFSRISNHRSISSNWRALLVSVSPSLAPIIFAYLLTVPSFQKMPLPIPRYLIGPYSGPITLLVVNGFAGAILFYVTYFIFSRKESNVII